MIFVVACNASEPPKSSKVASLNDKPDLIKKLEEQNGVALSQLPLDKSLCFEETYAQSDVRGY